MGRTDARLRELQFLARLDREGPIGFPPPYGGPIEEQMIVSLIHEGYLNDGFDELRGLDKSSHHELLSRRQWVVGQHIGTVLKQKPIILTISHKGRVRLSELEQQLKTGRDRDPTGLLLDQRHLDNGLAIAVLSAHESMPLSVAFLDMNGLKAINTTYGHPAGNEAIRAFFQAVLATLGKRGEAYRNGGDEVVVILPGVTDEVAGALLDKFVRQLSKDVVALGKERVAVRLTASCGSVSSTNPNEEVAALLDRADKAMYRAKGQSTQSAERVNAIAVGVREVIRCGLTED